MTADELKQLFKTQNNRFAALDFSTWPTQAQTFADSQHMLSEEEALLSEVSELRGEIAASSNDSTADTKSRETKQTS